MARETSVDISALEQAALDALRPICREAGLPLADAATPEPVVIVETVMTIPVASAPSVTTSGEDGDDQEDHRYDDDDDEYDELDDHDEDED